jgi:hypothetical protein
LQRDWVQYNSINRLTVLLLIMLAFSGLVFLLLAPERLAIRGIQRLAISLHSQLQADYSPDLHAIPLPPVDLSLVSEALEDRNNISTPPDIFSILNTPVPLVTPLPAAVLPTFVLFPTIPGPGPSATVSPNPPGVTPTITLSPTRSVTPTGTPIPTTTNTPTSPANPPTPSPTTLPTVTSTPPTPPTATGAGYPAQPTATLQPTSTSTYPINTPNPGQSPTTEPTATPITPEPTAYP